MSCLLYGPTDASNLISGSSAFSKSSLYIWKLSVHVLLKPSLKDFEHYFASNQQSALITKFLLFRRLTYYANYISTSCPLTLQKPHTAFRILQLILATSWYLTLWHHKPPLVVWFLSLLYFNLMLMLNFMVHSLWKPPCSGLLSPFCITRRKSPGNPQRTMNPTTGTNCQTQIPSYLTVA